MIGLPLTVRAPARTIRPAAVNPAAGFDSPQHKARQRLHAFVGRFFSALHLAGHAVRPFFMVGGAWRASALPVCLCVRSVNPASSTAAIDSAAVDSFRTQGVTA